MGEGAVTAILYAVRQNFVISVAVLFIKRTKAEKTVDFVKPLVAGVVFTFLIFKKFVAHKFQSAVYSLTLRGIPILSASFWQSAMSSSEITSTSENLTVTS